jgi:hypothetical protein
MSGLILPFNGLIKGGAKVVTLVSHAAADSDTIGRSGNSPAPFTTGFSPTAAQFVVGGLAGRVGTMESFNAQHTNCQIIEFGDDPDDGSGGITGSRDAYSQGKDDDGGGISMAALSGPLTPDVKLTGRSPDANSRIDPFGYAAGLFEGVGSVLDSNANAAGTSVTLDIVPGGYVFAIAMSKTTSNMSWTNITEISELAVGSSDKFTYAGIETTTSGTLTISVTGNSNTMLISAVSLQP